MENPDTLVLNMTFLGTVGVALLMFLVLFLLGIITLVLAGIGRLAAVVLMGLFGRGFRKEWARPARLQGAAAWKSRDTSDPGAAAQNGAKQRRGWRAVLQPRGLKSVVRTATDHHPALAAARREPPVLAEDWASAVAEADARAMARARAAAPEIKLSVRDLPDPRVPADKVVEVAPLVESALDDHRPSNRVLRSFKRPEAPHPLAPLDTGSLASLAGPPLMPHDVAAAQDDTSQGKQPLP